MKNILQLALDSAPSFDRCVDALMQVRGRIAELDGLFRRPLAWVALELLAHVLELEGPHVEYNRLTLAEALLECALQFHRPHWIIGGRWPVDVQLEDLEAVDQVDHVAGLEAAAIAGAGELEQHRRRLELSNAGADFLRAGRADPLQTHTCPRCDQQAECLASSSCWYHPRRLR